jgi:hypothetical protein
MMPTQLNRARLLDAADDHARIFTRLSGDGSQKAASSQQLKIAGLQARATAATRPKTAAAAGDARADRVHMDA